LHQEDNNRIVLEVKNLSTVFSTQEGEIKAVDDVSFVLKKGKVLGIVGESGCGKTVTTLSILRLLPRTAYISNGEIIFTNKDLLRLANDEMRSVRGNHIALIPQDPLTSLNPVYSIGNQIREVIELHQGVVKEEAKKRTIEVLDQVKIANPVRLLENYPHELSGGMRQRVIIAMALSCKPEILIADEPTTALDVTVQAQILNLIRDIQQDEGMSLLLITHDLGVIAEMCHDVIVMYGGQVAEYADVYSLYDEPLHPYTISLLKSLPTKMKSRLEQIEGQPPSLHNLPRGCYFEPRCPKSLPECKQISPDLITLPDGRKVRCILYKEQQ
jgi:oligopeptide/dipeptide ABC transporter ATP-binding protein